MLVQKIKLLRRQYWNINVWDQLRNNGGAEVEIGDCCAIKPNEKSLRRFNDFRISYKTWQQVITEERADMKHSTSIRTRDSLSMYRQVTLFP
jgi:hypothetical protein